MPRTSFLRFFFSAADQARIANDATLRVSDVPLATTRAGAMRAYANELPPQSLRIAFTVTSGGAPRVLPLFPGTLRFIPDRTAPGRTPTAAEITSSAADYAQWRTRGMIVVDRDDRSQRMIKQLSAIRAAIGPRPNRMWASTVAIPLAMLLDTLAREANLSPVAPGQPVPAALRRRSAEFLAGERTLKLAAGANEPQDTAVARPMPLVQMSGSAGELTIAFAEARAPFDAKDDEFNGFLLPQGDRNLPSHPRNGLIPARFVYRTLGAVLLDGEVGAAVAEAVRAPSPALPDFIPIRFTRIWKPQTECSIHLPYQVVKITTHAAGGDRSARYRLPAHGVVLHTPLPSDNLASPVTVSLEGAARDELPADAGEDERREAADHEMRWLKGNTPRVWTRKAHPQTIDLTLSDPADRHVVMRRLMSNEVTSDPIAPKIVKAHACTYVALRRVMRAWFDNRVYGGRLFARRDKTLRSPTVKLWRDARAAMQQWDSTLPELGTMYERMNDPPALAKFKVDDVAFNSRWLLRGMRVFFDDDAASGGPKRGEVAYWLWQTAYPKFIDPATRALYSDAHIGRGAAGAVVYLGLGAHTKPPSATESDFASMPSAIQGLEPGAVLQFWHRADDFSKIATRSVPASSTSPSGFDLDYGHCPTFREYLTTSAGPGIPETIDGVVVMDNYGSRTLCFLAPDAGGTLRLQWGFDRDDQPAPQHAWIGANWTE